ncbi:hypothetical protein PT974_01226 [Cladobotryum mycophilum]|uniref:MAGE domain-containing protein n=1 Tax=Cladobotryum mycophilum TaxID=491253 RepID=A0ABR0T3C5_9HYPO
MPPAQRKRRVAEDDDDEADARPRQRQNVENSDDDREEGSDEDMEVDTTNSADQQMAKKLIRYAISCEYSRTLIRRDGIKERVLGKQGRAFRRIFALAQTQLSNEVKLTAPVRIWGLHPFLDTPSRIPKRTHSPTIKSTQRRGRGDIHSLLYYGGVINNAQRGELTDQKLQRYLLRLNADRNVASEKTELVLKKMEKQSYVIKRVERPPIGQDGDHTIIWHVGPRAKEEVGLDGVMGLVREVYEYPEDPDFDKKLRSSVGLKVRQLTIAKEGEDSAMADDE